MTVQICQRKKFQIVWENGAPNMTPINNFSENYASFTQKSQKQKESSSWMGAMTFNQITLKRMTVQICQRKEFQIVWENGAPNMTPINQIFQQNLHYSSIEEAT